MYGLTLFGVGFLCGLVATVVPLYWFRKLLVGRLQAAQELLVTQRELENRRVGYDSGRDTLARSDGGRVGKVHDGMGERPGSLAKYHRDS